MDIVKTASVILVRQDQLVDTYDLDVKSFLKTFLKNELKLSSILIAPKDADVISREVIKYSSQCTYVLITVEDVQSYIETIRGIGNAFSEELTANSFLAHAIHICSENGFDESSVSRISLVPKSCEAHSITNGHGKFFLPIISIRNVFVFLEFGTYLSKHMCLLLSCLIQEKNARLKRTLFLNSEKYEDIVKAIKKCITQFDNQIQIVISYIEGPLPYRLKLCISGVSVQVLDSAEAYLRSLFRRNVVVNSVHLRSQESLNEFDKLLHSSQSTNQISAYLSESVRIIETCLEKYEPDNICLSFNGGKDCTALLHITSCILLQKQCTEKLKVFYVQGKDPFPEIEEFVQQCMERYELELLSFDFPIKEALSKLKQTHPEIKAILMGTRSTDPRAKDLQSFQMTDSNWPQFMRVSPLLQWSYDHIWQFLRQLNVPYCCLYDQGYTSLGCRNNTAPNQNLKSITPKGEEFFCPAYLLEEPSKERESRFSSS